MTFTIDTDPAGSDGPIYIRPLLRGFPDDLSAPVLLPKPLALIRMRPHRWTFSLDDRRLLNALFAVHWRLLGRPGYSAGFPFPVPALAQALRLERARGWGRVRRAVDRLSQLEVWLDLADSPFASRHEGPHPLFAEVAWHRSNLDWRFSPAVHAVCQAPPVWAFVDLRVIARLRFVHDIQLYEELQLLRGLRRRTVFLTPRHLSDKLHPVWHGSPGRFRRRVLLPALERLAAAGAAPIEHSVRWNRVGEIDRFLFRFTEAPEG